MLSPISSRASKQGSRLITCTTMLFNEKNSLSFRHFATEFKRINSNLHQARVQAAYDGAVLVNAWDRALDWAR